MVGFLLARKYISSKKNDKYFLVSIMLHKKRFSIFLSLIFFCFITNEKILKRTFFFIASALFFVVFFIIIKKRGYLELYNDNEKKWLLF
jgi:hypothetical protein